jgi:hypothetical protein
MREQDTIHDRMIFLLCRDYPAAQKKGFRKAIQKLQWDWEDWENLEDKPSWSKFLSYGEVWNGGIIPDIWFIDEECMSVVCIEVEDTSRINTTKLNQYVALWWHLDNMYWETHLLCSDRWGSLTPVPLTDFTSMGLAETNGHRLASLIEAELDAKKIIFELTKIYSIRDVCSRTEARRKWLDVNLGFGLRTNPKFNKDSFLKLRGFINSGGT